MLKPVRKSVVVKAPVRADIAGAFSDIPYFLNKYKIDCGEVVNISLPLFIEVSATIGRSTDPITIETPDLKRKIVGDLIDLAAQERDNACQIALNFIRIFALDSAGLKITITSKGKIPPASGLGTSSAVGIALIQALARLYDLAGINAPEFNYLIEQSMGIVGGKQDYYAAFLGGLNHLCFYGPEASLVEIIDHKEAGSKESRWLLERLLVHFSGQSRSSGVANARPEDRVKKDPKILKQLADQAAPAFAAIKKMDLLKLQQIVGRDRENWLELTSGYFYTKEMWQLAKIGESLGFAHRAGGAGNGGCLFFFGDCEKKKKLALELTKIGGETIFS